MSSSVWRTRASDRLMGRGSEVKTTNLNKPQLKHTYCIHECVDRHVLSKDLSFLFEVNTFIQQECIILINKNSKTKEVELFHIWLLNYGIAFLKTFGVQTHSLC